MRSYTSSNGIELPSVTTILSIIGEEYIIKWANYLGFKHIDYEKELDRTATKGTKLHSCLQKIVDPDNTELAFHDQLDEMEYRVKLDRFKKMLELYKYETIFTEKSLISEKLGYGGTIDWFAKINGFNLINDFKSSRVVKIKHLFQIGAYYNLMKDNGYEVDGGYIILVNDRISTLFPVSELMLIRLGKGFNMLVGFYENYKDTRIETDKDFMNKLLKKE